MRTSLWQREDLLAFADRLLQGALEYRSPRGARIAVPGPPGGYGPDIDGLEGYSRTFLTAGFRLAGERGADPANLAERYAEGLIEGTDPSSPERWVRMSEHGQPKVEAASIALVLDMTRPWIWDRLPSAAQARVVDYLAECVGDSHYPRNNWVWFRLVVQTFLRSVGAPHSIEEMQADLAAHDSFVRASGWITDGDGRNYDHYTGWALHLYPTLWARMQGSADLAEARASVDRDRLAHYLADLVYLVGADGSPLIQGRSLVYRFAAAAPFWVGALAQVDTVPLGALRRAATLMIGHFAARGVPDDRGLLTLGWHHEWRQLAQSYSGTGSPYWASKGLLGIALPAEHPVWSAPGEQIPAEDGQSVRAMPVPGWGVATAEGVARISNHGTDHATGGSEQGDSPLYARLGYSTATAPLLDEAAWSGPIDQAVVLVDGEGRRTHRAGMELLQTVEIPGSAGTDSSATPGPSGRAVVSGSRGPVRWVNPDPPQRNHGAGVSGQSEYAGRLHVMSVLRGTWEVRLFRFDDVVEEGTGWEAGGWALAGESPPISREDAGTPSSAEVSDGADRSVVVGLTGDHHPRVSRHTDASPLGPHAAVPVLAGPVDPGRWHGVAVGLDRAGSAPPDVWVGTWHARITWGDDAHSVVALPGS